MDAIHFLIGQSFWPDLAKIVLALIMLGASSIFLWISLCFISWYNNLVALEVLANRLRDDTMFELTAARARLSNFKQRIMTRQSDQQFKLDPKLLQTAGSVLLLFLQKERSLLKWGMLAINMASSAYRYVTNKGKN